MKELRSEIFSKVKEYFDNQTLHSSDKVTVGFPCFDHNEVNQALDSLLDIWISQGPKVKRFEREYADYLGMEYGVACNSGSSANLLALTSLIQLGYLSPGDEVIVPSATFTTVVSPILQVGLVPVFVDVELDTYNICPDAVKRAINKKTKLILVVHSLGCPAKMDEIMSISNEYNIPVFEDCCEAHGSSINGKKVGSFGLVSAWSFFVAHNMTTGEGGMVTTNSIEIKENLESIREFGRLKEYEPGMPRFYYDDGYLKDYDERYIFTNIGYNLRMTDISASLGIEQLKKLDDLNLKRVSIANKYKEGLERFGHLIRLPKTSADIFHSYYGFPIIVNSTATFSRKQLVNYLEDKNIETRAFMGGDLSLQPAYRDTLCRVADKMPNTDIIRDYAFFIGCHPYITDNQVEIIIKAFHSFFSSQV